MAPVTSFDAGRRAPEETVFYIRQRSPLSPGIGIILGSGLGEAAAFLNMSASFSYCELPNFPPSRVEGHAGKFLLGTYAERGIALMQGRYHLYEGLAPAEVTYPVRVMGALGVRSLIVTTAAGGIHPDLIAGDLMLISDHINLSGVNPLVGEPTPAQQRFVDMTAAYAEDYLALAEQVAGELAIRLRRGVHVAVCGPSYETPAEIRMCRLLGGDSVSMSLVPEVIVARSLGMKVLGLACITNKAAGHGSRVGHADVLAQAARIAERLAPFLARFCAALAD